jgi:hypothetical protein
LKYTNVNINDEESKFLNGDSRRNNNDFKRSHFRQATEATRATGHSKSRSGQEIGLVDGSAARHTAGRPTATTATAGPVCHAGLGGST